MGLLARGALFFYVHCMPEVIHRQTVRAILLTPDQEVLLMRIRPPDGLSPFWICPGGGREGDEEPYAALRRELKEEIGLENFELGPLVWRRQHTFSWAGKRFCQREQYHVVHVNRFEPVISDPVEAKVLDEFRWVRLVDLKGFEERVTPLSLLTIVESFLDNGPPRGELEVEILID